MFLDQSYYKKEIFKRLDLKYSIYKYNLETLINILS